MVEKTKALESESERDREAEPWLWEPEWGPPPRYLMPSIAKAIGNQATQRAASDADAAAKAASPVVPVSRPPPHVPNKDRAVVRGLTGAVGFSPGAAGVDALAEYEAAGVVIELKGMEEFKPSNLVTYYIIRSGPAGVLFPARFSWIAAGNIVVRWANGGFQADPYWLPMTHPDFAPRESGRMVGLAVEFKNSKPTGWVNVVVGKAGMLVTDSRAKTGADPELFSIMFGRSYHGPESVAASNWINTLDRGELKLQTMFSLYPPDGPPMWGSFSLFDENVYFSAKSDIKGQGVESTSVPVGREPKGTITWRQPLSLDHEWRGRGIVGKVQFSFVDGSFDARGRLDVKYPSTSPRLTGTINVAATSPERAWNIARSNNPAPDILPALEPETYSSGIALVGWGALNLRVTKGVNASAAFIVDPEGHLTLRGVLRAPRVMDLFDPKRWSVDIVPRKTWNLHDVPLHWAIKGKVEAGVSLSAGATLSASLRDLVVSGLYSTRPGAGSMLEISASLNASLDAWVKASAWLEGQVRVGLSLPQLCISDDWCTPELSIKLVSVKVGLSGEGHLRAYADLRPKITRFGATKPDEEAKYKLGGHLEIGGQFEVALVPEFSLSSVFGGPRFGFGGGSFGIGSGAISVDIEHTIGDDSTPTFKRGPAPFDSRKFVSDLMAGDAPKARPAPGKYVDTTTRKTTPTKDAPAPAHAAPKATDEELEVPFAMAGTQHHLYLKFKEKPYLRMASPPPTSPLSDKLRDALQQVEATQRQDHLSRDLIELLAQQHADLTNLRQAAETLEAEAELLGEDPTNLMASELPGLQNLASALAEYGMRYRDPQLTGITAMSTQPIAEPVVHPVYAPGRSARGIGRIGSHGSKPPSLRTGAKIWWLESEHIIPFATGKRLWEVVNLVVPERAGHEDRGQTTIMIYEQAARFKTPDDNVVSGMFEDAVRRIRAPQRMKDARLHIESGHTAAAAKEVEEVIGLMVYNLEIARDNAVERTNAAILAENQMYTEGSTQTNGERRGSAGTPEPPIPYPDQVDEAAARQFNDIIELAAQEIEAANILR